MVKYYAKEGYLATFLRVDTKQHYIPHTRTRVYLLAVDEHATPAADSKGKPGKSRIDELARWQANPDPNRTKSNQIELNQPNQIESNRTLVHLAIVGTRRSTSSNPNHPSPNPSPNPNLAGVDQRALPPRFLRSRGVPAANRRSEGAPRVSPRHHRTVTLRFHCGSIAVT